MSNTVQNIAGNSMPDGPLVIVRGYKWLGYKVAAIASNAATVLVAGAKKSRGTGYRIADVFEWDESLFSAISQAKSEVDRIALWGKAKRFDANQLPRLT